MKKAITILTAIFTIAALFAACCIDSEAPLVPAIVTGISIVGAGFCGLTGALRGYWA